eukprot:scaffold109_cov252-Pinguiococcus_pyrenoidosus.AAC.52
MDKLEKAIALSRTRQSSTLPRWHCAHATHLFAPPVQHLLFPPSWPLFRCAVRFPLSLSTNWLYNSPVSWLAARRSAV